MVVKKRRQKLYEKKPSDISNHQQNHLRFPIAKDETSTKLVSWASQTGAGSSSVRNWFRASEMHQP